MYKLAIMWWVLGITCIAMAIIIGFISPVAGYGYEGRLVFQSENEYSKFKEYIVANPEIRISASDNAYYLLVLSSAPPILIDYRIYVPSDVEFPYNYKSKYNPSAILPIVYGVAGTLMVVGVVLFGFKKWGLNKEEKDGEYRKV